MNHKCVLLGIICFSLLICLTSSIVIAIDNDSIPEEKVQTLGETNGYLFGNFKMSQNANEIRKFNWGESGKGYAAEMANNLSDIYRGKNAKVIGGDNVKNGADRKIINRDNSIILIQDKYYQTANQSVQAAFDSKTNMYKYVDSFGKPMLLEVPSDQYDNAIAQMKSKIEKGYVAGITDPNDADKIIKKGYYTYDQAKNIAKAGTVDSLKYDAKSGAVTALSGMGITFVLDFALCMINGENWDDSLSKACMNSLKVGLGIELIHVMSSQLARTNVSSIFKPAGDKVASLLGNSAKKALVDALGDGSQVITKGAVSKILQSHFVVSGMSIIIFSLPDIVELCLNRISQKQMLINLTTIIGGTAGATLGMIAGSSIGAPLGLVIGGVAGGILGQYSANTLLSTFLKSDSEEMYEIITEQFTSVSGEYISNNDELDEVSIHLSEVLSTKVLKDMYESKDRNLFAREMIVGIFDEVQKQRQPIIIPTQEQFRKATLKNMEGLVYLH